MTKTTNDMAIAFHLETTNYCSGNGTTKNSPTELIASDLSAVARVLKFNPGIPKPVRTDIKNLTDGLYPSLSPVTHVGQGDGGLQTYLQDDTVYDLAINGDMGSIPNSADCRYNDGDGEKDVYGGLISELKLSVKTQSLVLQDITLKTAQAKTTGTTPIVGGIPAYLSSAIALQKGVSAVLDGITSENLIIQSITQTISNTFLEDDGRGIDSEYIMNPVLMSREVKVDIECTELASNTWLSDELNATTQLVDITIVWSSFLTSTMTNMRISVTNQSEIDEVGLIKRKYSFISGPGFTIA